MWSDRGLTARLSNNVGPSHFAKETPAENNAFRHHWTKISPHVGVGINDWRPSYMQFNKHVSVRITASVRAAGGNKGFDLPAICIDWGYRERSSAIVFRLCLFPVNGESEKWNIRFATVA